MNLAIMQPYFFPYIGYFQLLNSVDKFIFYDDVNFIKGGWINRNRLFLAGAIRYVTVPLSKASPFQAINRTRIQTDDWATRMLATIHQSYSKAPFYHSVRELLEDVLRGHDGYISSLATSSIIATACYLGLEKNFVLSSASYGNNDKKGVARVVDICEIEGAKEYWNLPGGRLLYHADDFKRNSIDLKFVNVSIKPYRQFVSEFMPGLSILDVLMFNNPQSVKDMLSDRATETLSSAYG